MNRIQSWLSKNNSVLPLVLTLCSFFVTDLFAYAQTNTGIPNPVQNYQGVTNILCTFIAYFFWTVITITVIMVLVAAFQYVTAGDDTEKTVKGRKTLTYAAIGVVVALCAVGFPMIIASIASVSTTPLVPQCSLLGG